MTLPPLPDPPLGLNKPVAAITVTLPDPDVPGAIQQYTTDVHRIIRATNVHSHSFTCWKPGLDRCRLGYPTACRNEPTGPIQIDTTRYPPLAFTSIRARPTESLRNLDSCNPIFPFRPPDNRLIVYELHRPSQSSLHVPVGSTASGGGSGPNISPSPPNFGTSTGTFYSSRLSVP